MKSKMFHPLLRLLTQWLHKKDSMSGDNSLWFLTQTLCCALIAALGSDGAALLRFAHTAPAVQHFLDAALHLVGLSLIHIPRCLSLASIFFFPEPGLQCICPGSSCPQSFTQLLETSLVFLCILGASLDICCLMACLHCVKNMSVNVLYKRRLTLWG